MDTQSNEPTPSPSRTELRSFRAAFIGDTRLTDPQLACVSDDCLLELAIVEARREGLLGDGEHQCSEDDIEIGLWTERVDIEDEPTVDGVASELLAESKRLDRTRAENAILRRQIAHLTSAGERREQALAHTRGALAETRSLQTEQADELRHAHAAARLDEVERLESEVKRLRAQLGESGE